MQQRLSNDRHKLHAFRSVQLLHQGFFDSPFLVTQFLLVNHCCLAWASDFAQKLFRAIVGHKQSTAQGFQLLTEDSHRLDHELSPHDSALPYPKCSDFFFVESWVEAVYGQDLRRFLGWTHSPVKDWIVMYAQIISEPNDNPMHFF
jgi:hypothetical protein